MRSPFSDATIVEGSSRGLCSLAISTTGGDSRAKRGDSASVTRTSPRVAGRGSCRTFSRTPSKSTYTRLQSTSAQSKAARNALDKIRHRVSPTRQYCINAAVYRSVIVLVAFLRCPQNDKLRDRPRAEGLVYRLREPHEASLTRCERD